MPPQHIDPDSIYKEVEDNNEFFDNLVDMIPAKLYVGNIGGNDQTAPLHSKHQKGQHKDSKASKKAKLKTDKKNKFDPTQQESTRDKKRKIEEEDAGDGESDDDSMGDIQFQDNHEEEDESEPMNVPPSENPGKAIKNSPHQSRIEELRAKLRAKLEEKKNNTSATNGTSDTIVSKRAARRTEKKRRVDIAKKMKTQQIVPSGKTLTGKNGLVTIKIVKELGGSKINRETNKAKSLVDDLAGIDFGGIAGLKDDLLTKGKYVGVNKSLKNMGKKKSLERLLEEAEAKKARLRQLKESDDIEDKQEAKKMQWGDALKAANGEKVRDADTTNLKKAIKRKAKKKARSADAWKSRTDQTQGKIDERQSIRNHNLKQRGIGGNAGANLSSKRIKEAEAGDGTGAGGEKPKRARQGPHAIGRAGFEGKKQDFINKGKEKGGASKKNAKSQ